VERLQRWWHRRTQNGGSADPPPEPKFADVGERLTEEAAAREADRDVIEVDARIPTCTKADCSCGGGAINWKVVPQGVAFPSGDSVYSHRGTCPAGTRYGIRRTSAT
jgi:hypothetical protein